MCGNYEYKFSKMFIGFTLDYAAEFGYHIIKPVKQ